MCVILIMHAVAIGMSHVKYVILEVMVVTGTQAYYHDWQGMHIHVSPCVAMVTGLVTQPIG